MSLSPQCMNRLCELCVGCSHSCHSEAPDQAALFDDASLGLVKKEQGMAQAREHADDTWKADFNAQAFVLARRCVPFTSEDVTRVVGLPRGSVGTNQNNAVGAMMNALARRKIIKKTGRRVLSKASTSHGAELTEWIGHSA